MKLSLEHRFARLRSFLCAFLGTFLCIFRYAFRHASLCILTSLIFVAIFLSHHLSRRNLGWYNFVPADFLSDFKSNSEQRPTQNIAFSEPSRNKPSLKASPGYIKNSTTIAPKLQSFDQDLDLPSRDLRGISSTNRAKGFKPGQISLKKTAKPRYHDMNWALQNTKLGKEFLQPFFENGSPAAIHVFSGQYDTVLKNPKTGGEGRSRNKTLYVTTGMATDMINVSRNQLERNAVKYLTSVAPAAFNGNVPSTANKSASSSASTQSSESHVPIGPKDFKVISFNQGKLDDGVTPIRLPRSMKFSVEGPDYSLSGLNADTDRLVSSGHFGETTIEILGSVRDELGADFVIYENPFRIASSDATYIEPARVGVADVNTPEGYTWFACDPDSGARDGLMGCAGIIPKDEGGDRFDLSNIGLKQIKFIKIRDWGHSSNYGGNNTEGFDLDSIDLIHGNKKE